MKAGDHWLAPPSRCGYLPDRPWRLEYLRVVEMQPEEYMTLLQNGWRRFGRTVFRPRCPNCDACRSLRIDVAAFRPDRAQRRARLANEGQVTLDVGPPTATPEKLALLDRFHAHGSESKGWPVHARGDVEAYHDDFLDNPFPTEEWGFRLDGALVGLGYVDVLPGGLSGIYFAHDPRHHRRSLGTWNVLRLIDRARAAGLPHVYLGYYVEGCPSMRYKARFRPNQALAPAGKWRPFLDARHPGPDSD